MARRRATGIPILLMMKGLQWFSPISSAHLSLKGFVNLISWLPMAAGRSFTQPLMHFRVVGGYHILENSITWNAPSFRSFLVDMSTETSQNRLFLFSPRFFTCFTVSLRWDQQRHISSYTAAHGHGEEKVLAGKRRRQAARCLSLLIYKRLRESRQPTLSIIMHIKVCSEMTKKACLRLRDIVPAARGV